MGWARTAAILSSCVLIALILVRTYYSLVTGYLLPDESYYYDQFILDHVSVSSYRPFFHIIFLLFFQGTNSAFQLFLRGAFYSVIWAVGTVVVLYKILRVLNVSEKVAALVLLSLPLLPVFTVMAVFFVTETLGIFLALLGILFSARYFKSNKLVHILLSAVFFVLAYEAREPYLLLALGNFLILLLLKRQVKGLIVYALFIAIVVPVPVGFHPLEITQPISNYVFVTVPNFFSNLHSSVVQTATSTISSSGGTITSVSTTHTTSIGTITSS
ncbi:MAG: glycosyltransferase family 39 protein, partial [Thaumarchaeota archaeon]|nr:glycosyltransferase family 39 protein [Nitrososphaerota archaeon]